MQPPANERVSEVQLSIDAPDSKLCVVHPAAGKLACINALLIAHAERNVSSASYCATRVPRDHQGIRYVKTLQCRGGNVLAQRMVVIQNSTSYNSL